MSKATTMPGRMGKIRRIKYMLSRLRTEKIEPDASDLCLLQAYIDSKISLKDLINHTRQFSTEADYRQWIIDSACLDGGKKPKAALDKQFVIEVEAMMRRKHISHKL